MGSIKLEIVATTSDDCRAKTCPTVYRSADGRYYVQGFKVTSDTLQGVVLGDNEALVEINEALINKLK